MIVGGETRISDIIRTNEASIEVIASVSRHFEKLRNPILRRILAPRVSLREAAKIGKVSPNALLQKLEQIGFRVVYEQDQQTVEIKSDSKYFDVSACNKTLDVRPLFDEHIDPFQTIMHEVKHLRSGEILKVINYFEPAPLIRILEKKGFDCMSIVESDVAYTYIRALQQKAIIHLQDFLMKESSGDEVDMLLLKFQEKIRSIDVRFLEMPLPMQHILKELQSLPRDYMLYVRHRKVPQFILPDLDEMGYLYSFRHLDNGEVLMLVFRP